jgi:hypothetical protein
MKTNVKHNFKIFIVFKPYNEYLKRVLVLVMFILNDATTPSKFTNCFKNNDIIQIQNFKHKNKKKILIFKHTC